MEKEGCLTVSTFTADNNMESFTLYPPSPRHRHRMTSMGQDNGARRSTGKTLFFAFYYGKGGNYLFGMYLMRDWAHDGIAFTTAFASWTELHLDGECRIIHFIGIFFLSNV